MPHVHVTQRVDSKHQFFIPLGWSTVPHCATVRKIHIFQKIECYILFK